MSTEKIIRNQAKKSLEGNWTAVICAISFWLIIMIAAEAVQWFFCYALGVVDLDSYTIATSEEFIYNLISVGVCVCIFLISPVFNGIFKMFGNITLYNHTEIGDMFYFFKDAGKYFKTLLLNLALAAVYIIIGYGLDLYFYVTIITGKSLQDNFGFDILTVVLIASMLFSVIIKILAYLLFVHYPLIAYAMNDNIPISKCTFRIYGFSFRHFGSTIKLLFTFAGWIALCFFVVPAFYVLPYLMASMSTSAKWLFSLDKDRGLL